MDEGTKKPHVLMCAPQYFEVAYEINPWMHKDNPADRQRANASWVHLAGIYHTLGFTVETVDPVEGLPDMVFTANGALCYQDKVALPRFRFPERQPETAHFERWFKQRFPDRELMMPEHNFEGEGDAMFAGNVLYAGSGFRSDKTAHPELADFLGVEVRSIELVDKRFYHLDTCLSILDARTVAYFPPAFSDASQQLIESSFEHAIKATEDEAEGFGLNLVSDGRHVVMSDAAPSLKEKIEEAGYVVYTVDISEFKKSGGGIKCLTLFLEQIHLTAPERSVPVTSSSEAL